MTFLSLIGREENLFTNDIIRNNSLLENLINDSKFLVLGGAGSIGQAVVKEIFKRSPKKLYVVDISENNLVELVRDIRSSFGYIEGDFQTFALDILSSEFDALLKVCDTFDYVLNLSALKHVRSEKDEFTLMRMIRTNILATDKTIKQSVNLGVKKYFCVSTDKAANPVNMMGASKRVMEKFLMFHSQNIHISTARFANVAFSDGSLLHGFQQRLLKSQPIVAPNDIARYFLTPQESGELCLMSCLLGENKDIFFPKLDESIHLVSFSDIAEKFLEANGYEPFICQTEDEARSKVEELKLQRKWPCLFSKSDTTGEKEFEEFFIANETVDLDRFKNIGVVKNVLNFDRVELLEFQDEINRLLLEGSWSKDHLIHLVSRLVPEFKHKETGKYLDSKM